MSLSPFADALATLPSLQVLHNELDAFRKTGQALHLAHAARALDAAREELACLQTRAAHGVRKSEHGQEFPA
jgi:hypothetical protein